MVNKYPIRCCYCHCTIPANGGEVWKYKGRWIGAHLACKDSKAPQVIEVRFSSGETMRVNRRGRCEDAPCCGCCD